MKAKEITDPKTLQEAIIYFANLDNCVKYVVKRRWSKGVVCPTCGSDKVTYMPSRRVWQCKTRHPKSQFSVKVGTIMEDSPLGLDKWLPAMWQVANCKNGISSWELHRGLGVTQKTAWFMLHRVRLAMQDNLTGGNLAGEVEVDETYIGGKARNMHKDRRRRAQSAGRNMGNKTVVVGLLQREGKIQAGVVEDRTKFSMQEMVRGNVEKGTTIHSDEFAHAWRMDSEYEHQIVNHLAQYVDGNVHTNGLENFWALLKRGINGTYVSVEPFHLFRYVDEQAFRFNNREGLKDHQRFSLLVRHIVGRRLTYKELTGKLEGEKQIESVRAEAEPF